MGSLSSLGFRWSHVLLGLFSLFFDYRLPVSAGPSSSRRPLISDSPGAWTFPPGALGPGDFIQARGLKRPPCAHDHSDGGVIDSFSVSPATALVISPLRLEHTIFVVTLDSSLKSWAAPRSLQGEHVSSPGARGPAGPLAWPESPTHSRAFPPTLFLNPRACVVSLDRQLLADVECFPLLHVVGLGALVPQRSAPASPAAFTRHATLVRGCVRLIR